MNKCFSIDQFKWDKSHAAGSFRLLYMEQHALSPDPFWSML